MPNGSDLNHPIVPRKIIGSDTAKSNEANNPAVVPANNLTNPKITITVNEPITAGNNIVKSYKFEFPSKYLISNSCCNMEHNLRSTSNISAKSFRIRFLTKT